MSTRISDRSAAAGALCLLAACNGASPADEPAGRSPVETVRTWVTGLGDRRDLIACAMREGAPLAGDCRIEILDDAHGRVLILSTPDGGFRRMRLAADGAISAADGADEVRTVSDARHVLVAIAGERYAVPLAVLAPDHTP